VDAFEFEATSVKFTVRWNGPRIRIESRDAIVRALAETEEQIVLRASDLEPITVHFVPNRDQVDYAEYLRLSREQEERDRGRFTGTAPRPEVDSHD